MAERIENRRISRLDLLAAFAGVSLGVLAMGDEAQAVPPQDTSRLPRYDDAFRSAVAVWHMDGLTDAAGQNELKSIGAVTVGVRLTGNERDESLACGSDGVVAELNGGYLDAGQGTNGDLNLTGEALTVAVRLRCPSGRWGDPLFSKHGGHDRLVYNLFSLGAQIGFELGTRDNPDMTQVLVPLANVGPTAWHTVLCRYDGAHLTLFVDGVAVDENDARAVPCEPAAPLCPR